MSSPYQHGAWEIDSGAHWMQLFAEAAWENQRPRWVLSLGNSEETWKVLSWVILIISGGVVPPIWRPTHQGARTNQLAGRSQGRVTGISVSGGPCPGRSGPPVALSQLLQPRRPRSVGAEVRQVARVPGAAKSRPTESAAQLCCGTRAAGLAAPAAESRCPRAGRLSPPPPAGRKRRGAAREHLGRARAAGAALPELRAGSRSPPPGAAAAARRPHWQRRPRGRLPASNAVRATGGDWEGGGPAPGTDGWGTIELARREPSAQAPRLPLRASPALLPALGASPGGRGGPGGGAGARAGVLLRLGRGFPASFWVNFQSAKC